jgi:hypothetical protein
VTLVLEQAQGVEDDQMADVKVRGSGVETELDTKAVTTLEAGMQVLSDMDLHRALAQAIE